MTTVPGPLPDGEWIDLHTHTSRSDGVLAPAELLRQMTAARMRLVAITDHDTLAAVTEVAGSLPDGAPRVIAGIEINTVGREALGGVGLGRDHDELHILGYGLDASDAALADALALQRRGRRDRIALTLERARAQGWSLDLEIPDDAGASADSVGRPHVARALVRAGHARDVDDAFQRFLQPGGPCYVPRQGLGPRQAIEVIAAAGGIAVLAHAPEAPDRPDVISLLMDWGLRGLEVHHCSFDPPTVTRMADCASRRGLLATGGTDYHGDSMDYATARAALHIPTGIADALIEAIDR